MKAEMRALAHDLAKDSIVTDALAQFIAQVIEELHKTKIAPAEARALAAEAASASKDAELLALAEERDRLREALAEAQAAEAYQRGLAEACQRVIERHRNARALTGDTP